MKPWEKSKAAGRALSLQRNELRRAGPSFTECTASLPNVGDRCIVMAEDGSGRYRLPFPVRLINCDISGNQLDGSFRVTTKWQRDDGRNIDVDIVAWRFA